MPQPKTCAVMRAPVLRSMGNAGRPLSSKKLKAFRRRRGRSCRFSGTVESNARAFRLSSCNADSMAACGGEPATRERCLGDVGTRGKTPRVSVQSLEGLVLWTLIQLASHFDWWVINHTVDSTGLGVSGMRVTRSSESNLSSDGLIGVIRMKFNSLD